jgi:hypothetical protein
MISDSLVLSGVAVELQQHVEVVGDLRGRFGPLDAVVTGTESQSLAGI